jgi:hypothetical protein
MISEENGRADFWVNNSGNPCIRDDQRMPYEPDESSEGIYSEIEERNRLSRARTTAIDQYGAKKVAQGVAEGESNEGKDEFGADTNRDDAGD